ncbi:molybdopterin-dependent oxidoreductase [Plesiomonas shigelloides subsp. oncorhynchi]|nr:molybdopterin-dependent oxidoreductase [Plesiomonas shigelloides]
MRRPQPWHKPPSDADLTTCSFLRGARIIAINPLHERGLERFTAPQEPVEMLTGKETQLASSYYNVRIGGDIALLKGVMRLLIERHEAAIANGQSGILDTDFIHAHTQNYDALRQDVLATDWKDIERISGLDLAKISDIADCYAQAERTIICYGMGITQHQHGTQNVQQLMNLLLLKGNIGKPGAGICPLRGHSMYRVTVLSGSPKNPQRRFSAVYRRVLVLPRQANLVMPRLPACKRFAAVKLKGSFAWVATLPSPCRGAHKPSIRCSN